MIAPWSGSNSAATVAAAGRSRVACGPRNPWVSDACGSTSTRSVLPPVLRQHAGDVVGGTGLADTAFEIQTDRPLRSSRVPPGVSSHRVTASPEEVSTTGGASHHTV